jgi:hypothetical protein
MAIPDPGSDEELSDIPALLSTRIGLPLLGIAERVLTAKLVLFRSTARTPSFVPGRKKVVVPAALIAGHT